MAFARASLPPGGSYEALEHPEKWEEKDGDFIGGGGWVKADEKFVTVLVQRFMIS